MPTVGGFSVSSSPSRIGVRSYRVPGTNTYLPVRSEIAPLLIGAAREFHLLVEPLHTGWCWGYHYRAVTGGGSYSFHAAGIAIDLNAPRHPYGRRNTFSAADAARCRAIAKKYGLRWGGTYSGTKDEMHFEVIVGRPAALALVKKLGGLPPAAPVKPAPSGKLVVDGKLGPNTVRELQRDLKVTADGWFRMTSRYLPNLGPNTTKALQRRVGSSADGKMGPNTIKALQRRLKVTADGKWGPGTTAALQRRLNAGSL